MSLYLASQDQGRRVTAAELAETCDVPPGNVPTIVSMLSRAQLLDCNDGSHCVVHRAWDDATRRLTEALGSLSLADATAGGSDFGLSSSGT